MPVFSSSRFVERSLPSALATGFAMMSSHGTALAQGADVAVQGFGGAGASPFATLSRLSLALGVVLLAFWGCARLMRRLQRASEAGSGGLRIVGGLSLGQRERLVVVQAGDEQLLLGVSAGRIERLHVLDVPLRPTEGTPRPPPSGHGESADFRTKLLAAMQRRVPS